MYDYYTSINSFKLQMKVFQGALHSPLIFDWWAQILVSHTWKHLLNPYDTK